MDTAQVDQLRSLVQRLFRKFGTLGAGATPCGKPLSIAHAHALMVLAHGELTQQELAAKLCIDKSNVARLCAKLVEAGHAKQASGARDRRSRGWRSPPQASASRVTWTPPAVSASQPCSRA